jgi:trigger factor
MVSSVEKMEKNVATIKIEVSSEDFKKAVAKAYQKNRGKFNIDGFRKGKAPQKIIENRYGKNVFYEDAIDLAFPEAYLGALEEHKIDAVSRPSMESIDAIGEDEGLKMTVSVAVMPEVELGEYKGQEIEPLSYEPAEEDVIDELAKMQDQNSRMVSSEEGEAKDGDTATIDFEGFIDGVPFDGGKAEGHSLTLGSQTFIPGFEEQLVGTKKGDEVEVKVTFPEDYHADDFAGKEAVFNVKVNDIKVKEMPELDDEFAKDVSEFDTLDELKEDLKNKFKARKEKEAADSAKVKVVDGAVESAKFEIPDQMIEEEMEKSLKDFEYQLKMQGIDMEDYFKYTNMDKNKLIEEVREDSKKKIARDLVLTKITETESIEATDEEIDKEIEDQAAVYNMDVEKFKSTITDDQKEYFANSVKRKKTIDFLLDNAVQK